MSTFFGRKCTFQDVGNFDIVPDFYFLLVPFCFRRLPCLLVYSQADGESCESFVISQLRVTIIFVANFWVTITKLVAKL